MRWMIPISAFLLWVPLAHAQSVTQQAAQQPVQQVELSVEDCRLLQQARELKSARKGAAYKPGVDVRGKAVVPADLGADEGQTRMPSGLRKIVIDFGVDLASRYNLSPGAYTATAGIATISFDMDSGKLELDGKALSRTDARAVEKACAMQGQ